MGGGIVMAHYNTTHEDRDKLESYGKATATQDNRIANFFELYPGEIYTPWEIQSLVFAPPQPPITSVRRSMSDLAKAGILTKTLHKKEAGNYGRRSYAWTLNEKYRESLGVMQDILSPQDPQEIIHDEKSSPLVLDPTKVRKSTDGPKTSPQGVLFETEHLEPIPCKLCGKMLTVALCIKAGIGPVCAVKCQEP